jgi:hypothetical protein
MTRGFAMEMDDERLKNAFQACLETKRPPSRDGCPPPESLLRLLRSAAPRREAARTIDHVSGCGACAAEFQVLLEVLRQEKAFVRDVEKIVVSSERSDLPAPQSKRALHRLRGLRLFPDRPSWRLAALAAGLAVVCLAVVSTFVLRTPETFRSTSPVTVELLQPVDSSLNLSQPVFKWKAVKGSEYYIFELFDETLLPVWRSEASSRPEISLPNSLAHGLRINDSYFWMVTAHFADGETIASSLQKFTLVE